MQSIVIQSAAVNAIVSDSKRTLLIQARAYRLGSTMGNGATAYVTNGNGAQGLFNITVTLDSLNVSQNNGATIAEMSGVGFYYGDITTAGRLTLTVTKGVDGQMSIHVVIKEPGSDHVLYDSGEDLPSVKGGAELRN